MNQLKPIKGSWESNYYIEKKTFSNFKTSFSYKDRINESTNIRIKYPDSVPVICEKGIGKNNPDINKKKYLVPMDITIGNFLVEIKKRMKLQPYEALFLMINGSIPPTSSNFRDLYYKYKDVDGYLYITYTKENVFG